MRSSFTKSSLLALALAPAAFAQTSTTCNPLTASCPADPALGSTLNVDFTKGKDSHFTAQGTPTYGSDGVSFTVAKSGDAPQLNSNFYIMFGYVEVELQAAPGAGIVSSVVLESDDLDEIDWEWVGVETTIGQTNYFGKGDTSTYDRGANIALTDTTTTFQKYAINWTSTHIDWMVNGNVVRTLEQPNADDGGSEYPQTPMQLKIGSWSGGDSANAAGTIGKFNRLAFDDLYMA
jgi:beta-glucanase (GH16 family)